jgi:sterol desaturase/sphingolipid hydroxylase (fatty acid hydroxylase superfamily)
MDISVLQFIINLKTIFLNLVVWIALELVLFVVLNKIKYYDWKESISSIGVAMGYFLFEVCTLPIKFGILLWFWKYHLFNINMSSPINFILLLITADILYYWFHRISHTTNWFWLTHSTHHSSTQLTMASSYRIGWTSYISGVGFFWVPLVLIGFPPIYVTLTLSFIVASQLWLHTELIPRIKYLEYIINTPSIHRVHHSTRIEDRNKNFAGVFPFIDIIFGTFQREDPTVVYSYGLGDDVKHFYNPFKISLYDWFSFFKNFPIKSSFMQKWEYFFGTPQRRIKEDKKVYAHK